MIEEKEIEKETADQEKEKEDLKERFKRDVYCPEDTIWVYSTKHCVKCQRTYCKKHPNNILNTKKGVVG
jgi:hypothetical protein